jgi:ribonucleoside-diphosphate reductase alpha chain
VDDSTHFQYVLDPTAKRLVDDGVAADTIEDAYTLATNVERRIAFQAWVQRFVDHGISSTVNLPAWGTAYNNEDRIREFGTMLIDHLPTLRGMTVYPDGARGGQPLVPVDYTFAASQVGAVFVEQADVCDITKGGSCGA